jgi:hypothetical protein
MVNEELVKIVEKFAESGWDVLEGPAKAWLKDSESTKATEDLLLAIKQADIECGSCGCELDALYKEALDLLLAE